MKTSEAYEFPQIYFIEILEEGILCSSSRYGNESLDENAGVW